MTTETTVSAAQPADPWGAAAQTTTTADPWSTGSDAATASNDWLNTAPTDVPFDWMHPFKDAILPFDSWVETALNWLVTHGRPVFQAIRLPIDFILSSFQTALVSTPAPIMLLILFLLAWQLAGSRMGIASFCSLLVIGLIGAWDQAMVTLALVMTSVFFCLLIGLPLGIWLARSDTAAKNCQTHTRCNANHARFRLSGAHRHVVWYR